MVLIETDNIFVHNQYIYYQNVGQSKSVSEERQKEKRSILPGASRVDWHGGVASWRDCPWLREGRKSGISRCPITLLLYFSVIKQASNTNSEVDSDSVRQQENRVVSPVRSAVLEVLVNIILVVSITSHRWPQQAWQNRGSPWAEKQRK